MEQTVENTNKKRKLYTSEIVLYCVFGAIWLFGFVFAIFGVLAYNVGKLSLNPFYTMQKNFATFFGMSGAMDFRLWGSLVMIVAMIAFLISIFAYSSRATSEAAAKRRKEERMKILMDLDIQTKKATEEVNKQASIEENK
jgi:predicted membrane protein